MKDEEKTKEHLISELHEMRERIARLEKSRLGADRTEAALAETQERFRLAMEATSDGLWDWEIKTNKGYFSPAYYRMLGYEPSELLMTDRMWADMIHPDDRERTLAIYRDCIENRRRSFMVEFRMRARDGSWIWILSRGRVSGCDAGGRALRMTGTHVDITERKRSEEALRESEERFRRFADDVTAEGIIVHDHGMILDVNAKFAAMYGYDRQELIGMDHFKTLAPICHEMVRAKIQEEAHATYEAVGLRKDGSAFPIEIRITNIPFRGKMVRAASVRDLTEQKQTQEELISATQRLADIIEFLPDATMVIDNDKRVIAWNRAMEEMTGVSKKDMLGKGDHEYSIPFYGNKRRLLLDLLDEDDEELASAYQEVKRKGGILHSETFTPCLYGGKGAHVFLTGAPLFDVHGNRSGAIESIRDITERRRVEESLSRAEAKYRSIFENALEGIYQVTPQGVILSCNPAVARILGYDSPEELMKAVTNLAEQIYVNPGQRTELLHLVEERGEAKGFEAQFYRKDRSVAWVSLNVRSVRDERGKLAFLEGILQDITERKAMESRLLQSQKMEAVGKLAGGIAHDFNNILAAIIGYTEIAKGRLRQRELNHYLERVLSAADRARNLVTQILAFSRKAEKEIKPVDVNSLITEALKLLRAAIPSTIEIRQEATPSAGVVLADPTQLHQVMMNLFTNAAYAMREKGGTLEVHLSNVEITPETVPLFPDLKSGPHLKLQVSDTGTGIAPDILGKIFDPFFTTKQTGEGTGLGLSVVYGILKECGGTVTVLSEPGKGSTFNVYLPAIEHGPMMTAEPSGVIPGGRERIIFVDDEEALAEMGRELLGSLGYEITSMTGSKSALEIFRSDPDRFDLVITDMTMPGMTGKEFARQVLAIRPDIPIILCTGSSEIITEGDAKLMGIREFAMKPLNLRNLARLVRKTLESK